MAVQLATILPPLICAHLLGLILLLYSLEKTFGIVSRTRKRFRIRVYRGIAADLCETDRSDTSRRIEIGEAPFDSASSEYSVGSSQGKAAAQDEPASCAVKEPWIRGCSCQGGCSHQERWKASHAALRDEENLADIKHQDVLSLSVPVDLAWSNLACQVVDKHTMLKKQILHPTSGHVVPGEMMALVGPSGAGKSTLLDILSQRKGGRVSGQVHLNGLPVGREFVLVSMYVAQEEMFVPTLSCWETLHIHAALRNRSRAKAQDLRKRMQHVLSVMGLWMVRNTQVGGVLAGGIMVRGLSGGERRRLSIACALIAQPSLIFLDEPTSGLDSFAALNIMEHMSRLAAMGHTVVASIHQPRTAIWDMFHKVLLLSEGHQLFFGPPQEAINWFSNCLGYTFWAGQHGAEADWLMDLVSVGFSKPQTVHGASMTTREDVARASELWHAHCTKVRLTEVDTARLPQDEVAAGKTTAGHRLERSSNRHAVSWWTQFWWLLKRSLIAQLRNPTDVTSRLLLSCWIGLLAGLVFFNLDSGPAAAFQRMGVLYFTMLLFELLPFCYMSFYVWDRTFFLSDRASGLYSTSAYYAAHMTASLPFIIVNTLCGALAAYGFAGLRYTPAAILLYSAILVLQSLIAIQVMVFCVYVSATQDIAYVLATGYVGLSILLSGFFVRPSQLKVAPLLWLSYISYPRWSFQGLVWNELHAMQYPPFSCIATGMPGASDAQIRQVMSNPQLEREALAAGFSCQPVATGDDILRYWELHLTGPEVIGILAGVYALFHAMSYVAIMLLYRQKR